MPFVGELSALACAIIWSVTAFIYKEASGKMSSLQINAIRLITSSVYLIVLVFGFTGLSEMSATQFVLLAVSGLVGLVLGDTFIFKSYELMSPRLTSLFLTVNPAMAAIIAFIWLGEGLSLTSVVGIGITISGIAIVLAEGASGEKLFSKISKRGILFCVFSTFFNAIQLTMTKEVFQLGNGNIDALSVALIRICSATLLVYPVAFAMKKDLSIRKVVRREPAMTLKLAVASFFGTFIAIALSYVAVVKTEIGVAATLMSTTPILMIPVSRYLYKEKPTWHSIVGAVVAVGGVAILFMK